MKILPFLIKTAGDMISRLPIERVLIKPRDTAKDRQELLDILSPQTPPAASKAPRRTGLLEPRRKASAKTSASSVSSEETVAYQKRVIGKLLLRMERHYAQKMRIGGIPCDCGSQKHLLDIEGMTEETIPMVDDTGVYYRLLEWVKKAGPVSTDEAAKSEQYDNLYPQFSREARDFRKEIIGSLDPKALWPGKSVSLEDLFKKYDEADRPPVPESAPVATVEKTSPVSEEGGR